MRIYSIITPDASNTVWNLTGGGPLDTVSLDGVGVPNIDRQIQDFANQHGGLDYGFRLKPRELTLDLFYNATNDAAADALRDTIYSIFQPYDYPLKLKITRDSGDVRQIDCHTVGMVDTPESKRIGASLQFTVRLLAPNPVWYDPTSITHTFIPVAASGASTTTITYAGGWEEYPIIKLYGFLQAPQLSTTLVTPGGTVTYTINIAGNVNAGDVWTIDLRPGYKAMTTSAGVSRLGDLVSSGGKLMDFRLFQAPLKAGGSNTLTLSYTSKDASAKMEVIYYKRYLGI